MDKNSAPISGAEFFKAGYYIRLSVRNASISCKAVKFIYSFKKP